MVGCRDKLERMARAMGVATCMQLPETFEALSAAIAIPSRLRDLNMTVGDLEGMAELALQDHCSLTIRARLPWRLARQLYQDAF